MKYLFILGRNVELSYTEIIEFLKKERKNFEEISRIKNSLLVFVKEKLELDTIKKLGGTISIGEVLVQSDEKNFSRELNKIEIYSGRKKSFNYALWSFPNQNELILNSLKKKFKEEKLRATLKKLNKEIKTQEGKTEFIPSSKLIGEEFFSFENNEKIFFGKIIQKNDYKKIEERDLGKPVHRHSLDISIRLAKILINLSGIKQGETLYDSFCGIGTILQEALLQKIKVIGVDNDKKAIEGAKKNLKWFNFSEENYKLIHFDSTKVNIPEINTLVTEPDLGILLKKIPTKEKAEKILKKFEKLLIQVINNSKSKISGRIVFTSPYIRIGKKRMHCHIEEILKRTGYALLYKPFPEFREGQVVGRMIYVLEKQ